MLENQLTAEVTNLDRQADLNYQEYQIERDEHRTSMHGDALNFPERQQ